MNIREGSVFLATGKAAVVVDPAEPFHTKPSQTIMIKTCSFMLYMRYNNDIRENSGFCINSRGYINIV
jgi:hypothetical protein